jgi:hypothetical protein
LIKSGLFPSFWLLWVMLLWIFTCNIHVHLFEHLFSIIWDICVEVELLHHVIIVCFRNHQNVFPMTFDNVQVFIFSTSFQHLVFSIFLNYSYPTGYEVTTSLWFDLHFHNNKLHLAFSILLFGHSYIFGEGSIQFLTIFCWGSVTFVFEIRNFKMYSGQ